MQNVHFAYILPFLMHTPFSPNFLPYFRKDMAAKPLQKVDQLDLAEILTRSPCDLDPAMYQVSIR